MSDYWPGWEKCETCRGTGWIPDVYPDGWDVPDMSMSGCPVCTTPGVAGGLGYVPVAHQVEAAAEGWATAEYYKWESFDEGDREMYLDSARAALIAAARKDQG